ncbi:XAC2610-related protein [Rurimicrobium arvi]|uniref:XAC2610-related protein n=1 Tax=Rurimicrobium arvi TaxID=2049916 RepID=UPI0031DEA83C
MRLLIISLLSLLTTLASCSYHAQSASGEGHDPTETKLSLYQSLRDSIERLSFLNDYTYRDDSDKYVLHGEEINNRKIALIACTDSGLILFQANKDRLLQTDSIPFDAYAYSFEVTDLNGDGNSDFIIHSEPDIHGQTTPFVFLFSAADQLLHYRKDLQLSNIRFNAANKTIESYYEGCASCIHTKAVYIWSADSLILLKRAELNLTNPDQVTTSVYTTLNGIEKQVLQVEGLNSLFDTLLFRM